MNVLENIMKNKVLEAKIVGPKRLGLNPKLKNAGFTMIELIVVLGIFAVIMGVALFNQSGLNSNILITNLAYETALSVREAQTYGVGVRATASTTSTTFDKGYGVYFDTNNPTQVVVFGDSNGNNMYDDKATPSELQSLYQVQNQRGNQITDICTGTNSCTPLASGSKLSIMFKRPNPEATFHVFSSAGDETTPPGPVVIVVNTTDGSNCRAVVVEATGQIRVENSTGGHCTNATVK